MAEPTDRLGRTGVRSREAGEEGQSTAELALLLPVLTLLTLVVVQIGLVARDFVLINHAVREAARHAAVDPDDGAALDAASAAVPGLDSARLDVALGGGRTTGEVLTVELRYESRTAVPVVGAFLRDISLHTSASVRVE